MTTNWVSIYLRHPSDCSSSWLLSSANSAELATSHRRCPATEAISQRSLRSCRDVRRRSSLGLVLPRQLAHTLLGVVMMVTPKRTKSVRRRQLNPPSAPRLAFASRKCALGLPSVIQASQPAQHADRHDHTSIEQQHNEHGAALQAAIDMRMHDKRKHAHTRVQGSRPSR